MLTTEVFGDLNPNFHIQEDELGCMPAALVPRIEAVQSIEESEVIERFVKGGLFVPDIGTDYFPAHQLDLVLEDVGLRAREVYGLGFYDESFADEKIDDRLRAIYYAISEGEQVLMAFTKKRENEPDILHYVLATGIQQVRDGSGNIVRSEITLVDPSDRRAEEGKPAVFNISWDRFLDYITPSPEFPVMAWGISADTPDKPRPKRRDYSQLSSLPGMELLTNPVSKPWQTGESIPNGTRYPTSVGMTTHESHQHFNLRGDKTLVVDGMLPEGYPRFVISPHVHELSHKVMGGVGHLPFASKSAAEAAAHMERVAYGTDTEPIEGGGLYWLEINPVNLDAWQHTGLGISARHADALVQNPESANDTEARNRAVSAIKDRILEYYPDSDDKDKTYETPNKDDVYIFSNGMAAIYMLNQAVIRAFGDDPAAVFDFPYVDTFMQRKLGPHKNMAKNIVDMRHGDHDKLAEFLSGDGNNLRALITEILGNPVLRQADLRGLHEIADGEFPIIIDDTISTIFNVDDSKLPDSVVARVTSLTKFFSSVGDVMGGSIVLRPDSPFYEILKPVIDEIYAEMFEDMLWYEDAEAILNNSQYFAEIMPEINESSADIAHWLNENYVGDDGPLAAVHHPSVNPEYFEEFMMENGGYSGLMSLEFHSEEEANLFFDELEISKGPSLGTFYSIACQYTWLAHKPVEEAEKFGVKRHLVRISFGVEDKEDLMQRIHRAMLRRVPEAQELELAS